mgnify:CR=1 FL=1
MKKKQENTIFLLPFLYNFHRTHMDDKGDKTVERDGKKNEKIKSRYCGMRRDCEWKASSGYEEKRKF